MEAVVSKRLPSIAKCVQLTRSVASTWAPTDIRATSAAIKGWSTEDLLRLGFLSQAGGAASPVDLDRAVVAAAPNGAADLARDAVAGAFPTWSETQRATATAAVEQALLSHLQFRSAQALALHCLKMIGDLAEGAFSRGDTDVAGCESSVGWVRK